MWRESSGKKLTHAFIKSINKPGRYGDGRGGNGLSILAKKMSNGRWSKSWSQRITINGQKTSIGLGPWPKVTLAEARAQALNNAQRMAQGEDILKPKAPVPTVAEMFDKVIKQRSEVWKGQHTAGSWRRSRNYCMAILSTPVSELTRQHVLEIITPLWHNKPKTARTVRSNLSTVLELAINEGHLENNPATPAITKPLGKQRASTRQKSMDFDKLGAALALVRDGDFWWAERYALLFIALTGVRSGEARAATWQEIDLEDHKWTIPASRMKNNIQHQVPLSRQAEEILAHARKQEPINRSLIFPQSNGPGWVGGDRLNRILRQLQIPAVPHGTRSSLRNWAGKKPEVPHPAAEMLLAHAPSEEVVKAYLTDDFFIERQPVMQEWADYLSETMGPMIAETDRR